MKNSPSGSSRSSGRARGRGKKHEIYAAAFGGHLFYDLFSQDGGVPGPPRPPGSATVAFGFSQFGLDSGWMIRVTQGETLSIVLLATHLFTSMLFSFYERFSGKS